MNFFNCPDCRNKLTSENQCSCGWKKQVIKKINPFQCQYVENQGRCENEGTISKQVRGSIWYCSDHRDK